jgi:hypothetical protein
MSPQARREKADLPLATLIKMLILSKQIEGRSQSTLAWHRTNLNSFLTFVANDTADPVWRLYASHWCDD